MLPLKQHEVSWEENKKLRDPICTAQMVMSMNEPGVGGPGSLEPVSAQGQGDDQRFICSLR